MEKKTTTPKTQKKKNYTLLEAIEAVAESSKDSKMSPDFMKDSASEIKFLAEKYGISERQSVFFAICMDEGPNRVDYRDLARHLDLSNIAVLAFANDIDALVHRRLLRYRDVKDEDDFDVPTAVIRCLKHNEVYQLPVHQLPVHKGLDCAGMFEVLEQWFNDLDDNAISPQELYEEMNRLFDDNPQVAFGQKVKRLHLQETEELLLVLFCYYLICKCDDDIRFGQLQQRQGRFAQRQSHASNGQTYRVPLRGWHRQQYAIQTDRGCQARFACRAENRHHHGGTPRRCD